MGYDYRNKTVIVTGAASGIGLATAIVFLEKGANLVAVDKSVIDLEDQENLVKLTLDITTSDAPEIICRAAEEAFGGIDILINNAGIAVGASFEDTDYDMWKNVLDINLNSMFSITKKAVESLKKSEAGRIINIGSIMSDMAGPALCAYGTSKHAVAGFTKALAVDLGQYNITANYIQPGAIITGLSKPFLDDPEFSAYWKKKAPLGRLGTPEDVAAAIEFIASPAASFISGAGLNVDGGAIINF